MVCYPHSIASKTTRNTGRWKAGKWGRRRMEGGGGSKFSKECWVPASLTNITQNFPHIGINKWKGTWMVFYLHSSSFNFHKKSQGSEWQRKWWDGVKIGQGEGFCTCLIDSYSIRTLPIRNWSIEGYKYGISTSFQYLPLLQKVRGKRLDGGLKFGRERGGDYPPPPSWTNNRCLRRTININISWD